MYKKIIDRWLSSNKIDEEYKDELRNLDEKELEDRFYKELEFGTGGLRGIIGSGFNRMNIYTVGKVTQGYANFLNDYYGEGISVAIAYDSRIKSDEFAKRAALIFAANNIKVYLYESLRPTPMLSFALRHLKCKGGIVVTASHNPKEYNGYKVYGEDGGQLTDEVAQKVYEYICKVDIFDDIKTIDEETALSTSKLQYIGEDIDKVYIDKVKDLVIRKNLVKEHSNYLNIIYTPLHGTGYKPVTRVLDELGYENLKVVEEQMNPNGNFPTVPYPNPELESVFDLSILLAKKNNSDIALATDPDCDRVGIVAKDKDGNYKLLNGNQIGLLLLEYILMSLDEKNEIPSNGVVVKTIVTTELVRNICEAYKIEVMDVLTGFKYIGEKIKKFQRDGNKEYIFGFEESHGYLAGSFVRDKDGVIAVNLIAEMTLYYKMMGKTLDCVLEEIYKKYGFSTENLVSIELKGKEGQEKIANCLQKLRSMNLDNIGGKKIFKIQDYNLRFEKNLITGSTKHIDLPISNVIKILFEDGSWFAIRPSGTEPKMKIYISTRTRDRESLIPSLNSFKQDVLNLVDKCMG